MTGCGRVLNIGTFSPRPASWKSELLVVAHVVVAHNDMTGLSPARAVLVGVRSPTSSVTAVQQLELHCNGAVEGIIPCTLKSSAWALKRQIPKHSDVGPWSAARRRRVTLEHTAVARHRHYKTTPAYDLRKTPPETVLQMAHSPPAVSRGAGEGADHTLPSPRDQPDGRVFEGLLPRPHTDWDCQSYVYFYSIELEEVSVYSEDPLACAVHAASRSQSTPLIFPGRGNSKACL